MFIGRTHELTLFQEKFLSRKSELAVVYGRRRVGKSTLLKKFIQGKPHLYFEGLEKLRTQAQIQTLTQQWADQTQNPILKNVHFSHWNEFFSALTDSLKNTTGKMILVFDELQWLAAGRNELISILKFYWDNHWKDKPVFLILCGSVASFMVKKVIHSKALYGRITLELLLQGLTPKEAELLLGKTRSRHEVLKYLMVLGSIPKYLEDINTARSFELNMNQMCFTSHGSLVSEIDKIFFSQFKDHKTYLDICYFLSEGPQSLQQISNHLNIPSGGGLKSYLTNLEQSCFIREQVPFDKGQNSKNKRYRLSDEYLIFYFKFIKPHLKLIKSNPNQNLFDRLVKSKWNPWCGIAFESFCQKNALLIAERLGFLDKIENFGPYFVRGEENYQFDLVFKRFDQVLTVCEIKYYDAEVTTRVIPEMQRRCEFLKETYSSLSIEKVLISPHGPDGALRDSQYFQGYLSLNDFFKG